MKHPYIQIEELEEKIKERKAVGDFDTALEGRIRQVALRMVLTCFQIFCLKFFFAWV